MKLQFRDVFYEGSWENECEFMFETDMTLQEIEETFIPGIEPVTISIYDGDQLISRYYNKGLTSVKVTASTPRRVTLSFDLTRISPDAEIRLSGEITTLQGEIETLTFWMNQLKQVNMFEVRQDLTTVQTTLAELEETVSELQATCIDLSREKNIINVHLGNLQEDIQLLEDRVAALEPVPEEPEPVPESQEEPNEEEGE